MTKACSPAEGVERISRSTPPTEPEAAITEMARPSIWSFDATTIPSMSSIARPASFNASCVTS